MLTRLPRSGWQASEGPTRHDRKATNGRNSEAVGVPARSDAEGPSRAVVLGGSAVDRTGAAAPARTTGLLRGVGGSGGGGGSYSSSSTNASNSSGVSPK